ncbi:hypothetical protein BV25DRAFT_1915876 [Artomyces pyxidatus]|uniref:Uncharacterized protein n=1 Tax=Artomyces pyxidatus TaxID=48021 RepID=A0ACB8T3N3_9AGAM|nr:hypothetical protein BV25DRAFT_1915876 [Artomyces pyxidatus]
MALKSALAKVRFGRDATLTHIHGNPHNTCTTAFASAVATVFRVPSGSALSCTDGFSSSGASALALQHHLGIIFALAGLFPARISASAHIRAQCSSSWSTERSAQWPSTAEQPRYSNSLPPLPPTHSLISVGRAIVVVALLPERGAVSTRREFPHGQDLINRLVDARLQRLTVTAYERNEVLGQGSREPPSLFQSLAAVACSLDDEHCDDGTKKTGERRDTVCVGRHVVRESLVYFLRLANQIFDGG